MARVRTVFILRNVTWKYKVYKDEAGTTRYIYEPQDGRYKPIRSDAKLETHQLLALMDEQEFRWYNRNPRK